MSHSSHSENSKNSKNVQTAVEQLLYAQAHHIPCAPIRTLIGENNIDLAYQIQQRIIKQGVAEGRRLVGSKIGLTSKSVQKQLGVEQPDFGRLFADMSIAEGEEIAFERVLQPKVEAEVALVLEKDLAFEKNTITDLLSAVAYALPAIEIVGSRIANWDIRLSDTIADNASSGLFVLGNQPVKLADVDLLNCGMVMDLNGELVSVGNGAACMGNPLYAALWLADTLVQRGSPLQAGDIILTGALGPMAVVKPGDVFNARISGLGNVSARFL